MSEPTENVLRLLLTPDVGATRRRALLERFGDPENVFRATRAELLSVDGVGRKTADSILTMARSEKPREEIERAREEGVEIITSLDDTYPRSLREIHDPPPVLYVKGDVDALSKPAVAVVGSRRNTFYGQSQAERISAELGRFGLVVSSGLARGIDSAAHRGALKGGGETVGVLGCGVDVVYPPENGELYEKVAAHGAVVSEFPLGTPPEGGNFPRRNRVICGLAMGVFVVEAAERSGTLITVNHAVEQGKGVFALPGPVNSITSRGTHKLIKEGAVLVEEAADIIREIAPELMREKASRPEGAESPTDLDDDEKALYELLSEEPRHMEYFLAKTDFAPGKIHEVMLRLQMKNLTVMLPGSLFARKL